MAKFKMTTDRMMMLMCLVVGTVIALVVSKIDGIEPVELKSVSHSLSADPFLEQVKRYSGKGGEAYVNPSRRLGVLKEVINGSTALIDIGEFAIKVELAGIIVPLANNITHNHRVGAYKAMSTAELEAFAEQSLVFWQHAVKPGDDVILEVEGLDEGDELLDFIKDGTLKAVVYYRSQSGSGRPKMAQVNRNLVKAGLAVPERWAIQQGQLSQGQSLDPIVPSRSRRSDYSPEFFRAWRVKRGMFAHKAFH